MSSRRLLFTCRLQLKAAWKWTHNFFSNWLFNTELFFWRGKSVPILNIGFGFIHRSSKWRWSDSCVLLQGASKELHSPFFVGTGQTAHTGGDPARPQKVRQLLALSVGVAFSCPLCYQSCSVNSKEVAWGRCDEHTVPSQCWKPAYGILPEHACVHLLEMMYKGVLKPGSK